MCEPNVPLSQHTNYRIGGPARFFCHARTLDELLASIALARREKLPIFTIGSGTNLLVGDQGFAGVVVQPAFADIRVHGATIEAEAGALLTDVVAAAAHHGLTGLEWAGGLPGTVGGAVRGNAGAFGGEMKDIVHAVTSLTIGEQTPATTVCSNGACHFGYRSSVFKERGGEDIILAAQLSLARGDRGRISELTEEKIRYRQVRHPLEYPNVGSIFKNVDVNRVTKKQLPALAHVIKQDPFPVVPTAYLIAQSGLMGVSFGGAMVSPKHPNFIVNVCQATAADVRTLIDMVKRTVRERFGIRLEEEVMYV